MLLRSNAATTFERSLGPELGESSFEVWTRACRWARCAAVLRVNALVLQTFGSKDAS
jgi:hypothetical protein